MTDGQWVFKVEEEAADFVLENNRYPYGLYVNFHNSRPGNMLSNDDLFIHLLQEKAKQKQENECQDDVDNRAMLNNDMVLRINRSISIDYPQEQRLSVDIEELDEGTAYAFARIFGRQYFKSKNDFFVGLKGMDDDISHVAQRVWQNFDDETFDSVFSEKDVVIVVELYDSAEENLEGRLQLMLDGLQKSDPNSALIFDMNLPYEVNSDVLNTVLLNAGFTENNNIYFKTKRGE